MYTPMHTSAVPIPLCQGWPRARPTMRPKRLLLILTYGSIYMQDMYNTSNRAYFMKKTMYGKVK